MDINIIKSDFQFIGNQIKKVSLKNDFVTLPNYEDLKLTLDTEYEVLENVIDDEAKRRFSILDLTVKAEAKDKQKHKLSIQVCVSGCFTATTDTSTDDFDAMLSLNGCAALYSIARALILSLSSQSLNGGQLIIPMVNFFRMKEKKDLANESK